MEKSHVGMGYHLCPVCGREHDPVVLLNRFLRNTLTSHEFVGWKMCEEHMKLCHDGFTALVEVKNQPKSLADVERTGNIAHVRNSAWSKIFDQPLPDKGIAFVEVGLFAILEQRMEDHHIMELAELHGH